MDERDGTAKGGPKACGRIGYEVGIAAILAKSRSFPLISVHLSRALGWDMGVNGGGLGLFGGDIGGFGGHLRGLGERCLRCLDVGIGRLTACVAVGFGVLVKWYGWAKGGSKGEVSLGLCSALGGLIGMDVQDRRDGTDWDFLDSGIRLWRTSSTFAGMTDSNPPKLQRYRVIGWSCARGSGICGRRIKYGVTLLGTGDHVAGTGQAVMGGFAGFGGARPC